MEELRLRDQDLVWREVGDEVVILDMRASVYASVNETGRVLWLRLAEGASLDDLAAELRRVYGLDDAAAKRDANEFVESLREQGLLA